MDLEKKLQDSEYITNYNPDIGIVQTVTVKSDGDLNPKEKLAQILSGSNYKPAPPRKVVPELRVNYERVDQASILIMEKGKLEKAIEKFKETL